MLPLLLSLSLLAADPPAPPPIRLPAVTLADPAPPSPMPGPAAPAKLGKGQRYVIDCKVECVVRAHPAGLVTVSKKSGPRDISASFSDGTGEVEDRTFAGPFVYVVTATHTGRVEIDVIPLGLKGESEVVSAVIDVDAGDKPQPPQPGPGPAPLPTPGPDALPAGTKLLVKVVDETKTWPPERADVFADKSLRDAVKALTGADLEIVRPDSKAANDMGLMPFVAKAGGGPALIVIDATPASVGVVRLAAPLPATKADILNALNKLYGK